MEKWSSSVHQGNVFLFPGCAIANMIASTDWTRKIVQVSFDQVHLHWTARAKKSHKGIKQPGPKCVGGRGHAGALRKREEIADER